MREATISILISLLSILTVIALSVPAKAGDEIDRHFAGSHLRIRLSDDSITSVDKFETELETRYRAKDFSGFVRASNLRPYAFEKSPFKVQKIGMAYSPKDWKVTLGDYSLVYGRGLALDAVENRDVDLDAQLRGAMVNSKIGDAGNLTAFWGVHKSDTKNYFISGVNTDKGGPMDTVRGARMDGGFKRSKVNLGLGWLDARETRLGDVESTAVTEFNGSWHPNDFSLYYESAWFNRPKSESSGKSDDGRGQLAELGWAKKGISLAGSWILYQNAMFDYATAPTLKRIDLDASSSHPDDETGYRFDSHWAPKSWKGNAGRVLYSNVWARKYKGQGDRDLFLEWTTPQTKKYSSIVSADFVRGFLVYYGALPGKDTLFRYTLDGPCPLGGTFHLQSRYRLLKSPAASDHELQLGLDWNVSDTFTVGFFRETSSRPFEPPPPGIIGISTKSPGIWFSGYIKWMPDARNELDILVGSQRGGFQCSGGVCAQVPPFNGVKVTYYRTI